jgi:hypothetical protein
MIPREGAPTLEEVLATESEESDEQLENEIIRKSVGADMTE